MVLDVDHHLVAKRIDYLQVGLDPVVKVRGLLFMKQDRGHVVHAHLFARGGKHGEVVRV